MCFSSLSYDDVRTKTHVGVHVKGAVFYAI
jgi:hypothetical protein